MTGRQAWAIVIGLLVTVTACSDGFPSASGPHESGTGLPIASASQPPGPSRSAPASLPVWDDPDDPVAAYRELIEKIAYMRAHPSMRIFRAIYAPRSRMAGEREVLERMIRRGTRLVDGRTVIDTIEVISQDNDTVFLEVRGREEGWVNIDADGNRSEVPTQCEQFVIEMRRGDAGWRLATLIGDRNKSFWRCEP